jgi:transcriptional regulator with XRE-family HTH domain
MAKLSHAETRIVLAGLLRHLRQEASLRQQDLAERLNQPQSFVSKYESGERRLDLVEIYQICNALGISLTSLAQSFEEAIERKT